MIKMRIFLASKRLTTAAKNTIKNTIESVNNVSERNSAIYNNKMNCIEKKPRWQAVRRFFLERRMLAAKNE